MKTMNLSRSMNIPYLSQDKIKNIKKSIITNLTQLDASLKS